MPLPATELARIGAEAQALLSELKLLGTLTLTPEGYNLMLSGPAPQLRHFWDRWQSLLAIYLVAEIEEAHRHETVLTTNPFAELKVKIKKALGPLGSAKGELSDPQGVRGTPLNSDQWDLLLASGEAVLVDTRNYYEYIYGHFQGALDPGIARFEQFPKVLTELLAAQPSKRPLALYCTGGIRCRKLTPLLKQLTMPERPVYELAGGIIAYLRDRRGAAHSQWQGSCFVFDRRVALNHLLQPIAAGREIPH